MADGLRNPDAPKYRLLTRLAASSAELIICPSQFLCARYGTDPAKVRVIRDAPALPPGGEPAPPGP